jgi:hypothetical protein
LFYKREALTRADGFDEVIGFFGEDTMAGWAVHRLGGGERFAPFAIVHHAVTHPGLRWHLRRCLRYGNWNKVVRRYPEVRELFWHRFFLRRASAETLLALCAVLCSFKVPFVLVLAVPFLWRHLPWVWSRTGIIDALGGILFDLAIEVALVWGSIRERTLLL